MGECPRDTRLTRYPLVSGRTEAPFRPAPNPTAPTQARHLKMPELLLEPEMATVGAAKKWPPEDSSGVPRGSIEDTSVALGIAAAATT